jgi:signal transduction histidine kinase
MRCLLVAFFVLGLSLQALAYDKEVLLLQSYNKGLKWTDGISEGVLSVFKNHPEYEVTTEYMDSKKIDSKAYFDSMLELYRKKFANRHYEVILAADNFALDFALQYADELFPDSPIVFCGVENFNPAEIEAHSARHKTTGVVEYKEVEKSLALIGELVPNLKKLYIISDRAYSSMRIKDQILAAKEKFSAQFEIVYDNDIVLSSLPQKLENLPTRSAVLFTSLYRDANDVYVPYAKLKTFFTSSSLPIFALTSIHLGEGVVGGIMVDPFIQGSEAAQKAIQIVKSGTSPEQIPITTPRAQPMFDMKMLTKHALYTEKLPENAIVINKPLGFLERNREFVNSVFTLSPLLVFFTLALLYGLYKKTVLEEQLRAQSELDSVLLNTIQSAIFWRSSDGNLLGCNKALCLLLNKSKEEIIGKHINEVMPQFCHYLKEDEVHFKADLEVPFLDIDGKERHLMVRRKRFEHGIVTIATDITQRMQIEHEYKRHEQFVLQRSKQAEVGEMLASIAHQWKTPLIEISAIAQSLFYARKKREISTEEAKAFSHDIMQQVTYMTQTIDDFRTFIKPSTEAVMFDVKQAISEILSILSHTLKYNYINVAFTCKESASLETYGYPNEFKQTLLNMLNNAKDAILKQRKQGNSASNIWLGLTQTSHQIMLSVEDDGGGIDPESLPHVFDPFYSTKEHGDGFGLYMAKLIIEDKMHGRLLASNTDKGAKMSIYLEKKSSKG